jgi:hypothetical protein
MEQKNIEGGQSFTRAAAQNKRPYEEPRIISEEPLEVAAASCNPPTGGYGKTLGPSCAKGFGS